MIFTMYHLMGSSLKRKILTFVLVIMTEIKKKRNRFTIVADAGISPRRRNPEVYNDRPFPEKCTVKDHTSSTKLEKGRSLLHPNTAQGSFFPLQYYSKKTLRKNVPKSARKYKRNALMPPGYPIILLKSN